MNSVYGKVMTKKNQLEKLLKDKQAWLERINASQHAAWGAVNSLFGDNGTINQAKTKLREEIQQLVAELGKLS